MNVGERMRTATRAVFSWIGSHKIVSCVLAFVLWMGIEVALLPYGNVSYLKSSNPGETAFMRDHREEAEAEGKPFRIVQRWVPLGRISKDAINAVIVSEDGTFWSHGGFDWFEFRESIERNVKEGKAARGAAPCG